VTGPAPPVTPEEFWALMAPLGPFGAAPGLAVAVSGGADSSALVLLAHGWAAAQGGRVLALVVDHRMRPESAAEAETTRQRLVASGIEARVLTLSPPPQGSEAARAARLAALEAEAAASGLVFLLLAQHRADQAETLLWRDLRGSAARGLAAMPARRETALVAVLRPLLGVPPARLRATCQAHGLAWVTDPTNRDPAYARPRLRALLADAEGQGSGVTALAGAAFRHGAVRAGRENEAARLLAQAASLLPEGFALVVPERLRGPEAALAAAMLLRAVGGQAFLPDQGAALALLLRGHGTLAGVQALAAGRLGPGLLLVREPAACAPAVPATRPGWDGRWRLHGAPGLEVGALGGCRLPASHAPNLPAPNLPAIVRRSLPAFRDATGKVVAVPALGYGVVERFAMLASRFAPAEPAAPAPFLPGSMNGS
jgi:tRNA(Ile)-lysidine synthase